MTSSRRAIRRPLRDEGEKIFPGNVDPPLSRSTEGRGAEAATTNGNTLMQYLLLIYSAESDDDAQSESIYAEFGAFTQGIVQSGNFKSADRLKPVATATTVRVREGRTLTTDGPFAETREQLGGYYLIEAKDLDEAIAIAAKVPSARYGSVEVRPVWAIG